MVARRSDIVIQFIRRLCVQLAEQAGWLYQVRTDVVSSYLSAHNADSERALGERSSSVRFVLAGVAILANVSALVLIAFNRPADAGDLVAKREQEAIVLYKELVTLQETAQGRPEGSNDDLQKSFSDARNQLNQFLHWIPPIRHTRIQSVCCSGRRKESHPHS